MTAFSTCSACILPGATVGVPTCRIVIKILVHIYIRAFFNNSSSQTILQPRLYRKCISHHSNKPPLLIRQSYYHNGSPKSYKPAHEICPTKQYHKVGINLSFYIAVLAIPGPRSTCSSCNARCHLLPGTNCYGIHEYGRPFHNR